MRLLDLEPAFLKINKDSSGLVSYLQVDDIKEADGIMFLCPACFEKNKGAVGTHSVLCWRPHVPVTVDPKPGRWEFRGTGYGDLSLVAGSSSVFLPGSPCKAHFFIKDGVIA